MKFCSEIFGISVSMRFQNRENFSTWSFSPKPASARRYNPSNTLAAGSQECEGQPSKHIRLSFKTQRTYSATIEKYFIRFYLHIYHPFIGQIFMNQWRWQSLSPLNGCLHGFFSVISFPILYLQVLTSPRLDLILTNLASVTCLLKYSSPMFHMS